MPKKPAKPANAATAATTAPENNSDAAAAAEAVPTPTLKQRIADLERKVHGRDLYAE